MTYTITPAPGTISITAGGTAIVGVGTAFTVYLKGYLINVPGFGIGQLADDPADDTHATLVQAISSSAISGKAFAAYPQPNAAVYSERVRELIETLAIVKPGVPLTMDSTLTVGDPGAGKVRFNSATNPTIACISYVDSLGGSCKARVQALDDSVATVRSLLEFMPADDANAYLDLDVTGAITDGTTYAQVPVVMRGGTVPANGASLGMIGVAAGPTGSAGANGTNGTNGANGLLSGAETDLSANHTVVSGDNGNNLVSTAATSITLALTAAASLGAGFGFVAKAGAAGAVVIDPNGSETIDGATTLTLAAGQSAFIFTNGTAWRSMFLVPLGGTAGTIDNALLRADGTGGKTIQGSTVTVDDSGNLTGVGTINGATLTARGHLFGLTTSNDATTPNTIIDIAAGEAASDDSTPILMILPAAITKTTAAWTVGSTYGGLDTGTIAASTWYYVWLIERPDTSVVDVLLSLSATSPTMPANYTKKRRIGSILTDASSHILPFWQDGDDFLWGTPLTDVNTTNPGTSAITETLTAPPNISTFINLVFLMSSASTTLYNGLVTSLNVLNVAPSNTLHNNRAGTSPDSCVVQLQVESTNGKVRLRVDASDSNLIVRIFTFGWADRRGKQY